MTATPTLVPATRYVGGLPTEHPYAQRLITSTREAVEKHKTIPSYQRHPMTYSYVREVEALDTPSAATSDLLWMSWIDRTPPDAPGANPGSGGMITSAYWQARHDPEPGTDSFFLYRTDRRRRVRIDPQTVVDVPVWRLNRADAPHAAICTVACEECGTNDYWNLPEFIWPDHSIGLSDPKDPTRLAASARVLLSLGGKLDKVILTPRARFEHGQVGIPAKIKRARVTRVVEQADGDKLLIRWNGRNGGESVVNPRDVEFAESVQS